MKWFEKLLIAKHDESMIEKGVKENLTQGDLLDNDRCIVLILDKEDIRSRAKDIDVKISDDQVNQVFEYLQNKFSDLCCDGAGYWDCIDFGIEQVKGSLACWNKETDA